VNGISNGQKIMRLETILHFDQATKKVGFLIAKAIRFISAIGEEVDFMQTVPRENGLRENVRADLLKNVTQAIANSQIAVNIPTSPGLPALATPLTYRVADYIGFIFKSLPKRRIRRMLTYYFPIRYSEAFCLKREYVDGEFAKKIQTVGASLQSISYSFSNSLDAAVFKFYSDGECWVSVEVSMNLFYNVHLNNSASAAIVAVADLGYWSAHIEIDNCWPKCGDIMDEVKAKIREQIDENKRIVLQFADLSSYAMFASAHIDLDGVTIFMEPR